MLLYDPARRGPGAGLIGSSTRRRGGVLGRGDSVASPLRRRIIPDAPVSPDRRGRRTAVVVPSPSDGVPSGIRDWLHARFPRDLEIRPSRGVGAVTPALRWGLVLGNVGIQAGTDSSAS
jgi:hypothetical protein